jgi:hypothetical protein
LRTLCGISEVCAKKTTYFSVAIAKGAVENTVKNRVKSKAKVSFFIGRIIVKYQ